MSNLGLYQDIAKVMKKVGGPKIALPLFASISYGVGRLGEFSIKKIHAVLKKKPTSQMKEKYNNAPRYEVIKKGISNEGVQFDVGDEIKLLVVDNDLAFIEKIGDDNSPYFISLDLLKEITNYN